MGASVVTPATQADSFRTDSLHGPIYTKTRKIIVLATLQNNYIAVPLYTHHGQGLEGKAKPEDFVSVRDHRTPGSSTPLSAHHPLVTEHLNDGTEPFHVKAAGHVTYPVSRKHTLAVLQEGRLEQESVQRLSLLFRNRVHRFWHYKEVCVAIHENLQLHQWRCLKKVLT